MLLVTEIAAAMVLAAVRRWPVAVGRARRPLSILVADDDPASRSLIAAMLRRQGHVPACVENGRIALDAARSQPFDCILMDMQMPEMDGIAAARAIRALGGANGEVPIIAITADASSERRRFYDNAGLTDFMTKPIDVEALGRTLAAIAGPRSRSVSHGEPAHEGAEPFDERHLAALRAALGPKRIHGLLDLFAGELLSRPAAIRHCAEAGEQDRMRQEAHSLRGAALNIGARRVAAAAEAVENAAGRCSLAAAIDELDQQAHRALDALDQRVPAAAAMRR